MFTNREELFDKHETTRDHADNQREESQRMETDRSNTNPAKRGLFQGCFKEIVSRRRPIHDEEDDVDRCPICTWETEAGECFRCGYRDRQRYVSSDLGSLEMDTDDMEMDMQNIAMMDEMGDGFWGDSALGEFAFDQMLNGNRLDMPPPFLSGARRRRLRYPESASEDEEETSEDETDDGEMASFITDDEGHEDGHGTDRSTMLEDRSYMPDDVDHTSEIGPPTLEELVPVEIDDSAEEAETSSHDEENVMPSRNAIVRRRRQVVSSSPAPSVSSAASSSLASANSGEPMQSGEDHSDASLDEDQGSATESGTGNVGTSRTNAITIDDEDDDDEGPIRPTRANRIKARRTRRQENRRHRRSQEQRRS
jgi:hypothetical protein